MVKIIEAQGPAPFASKIIGSLAIDVRAERDGVVAAIDCLRLNRLARTAGAPLDKGAGIKLFKKIGNRVEQGEPLYRIHAFESSGFDLAVGMAQQDSAYRIEPQTGAAP